MSVIHAPKEPELDARHLLFPILLLICLLVFVLRLWYLQVVIAPELEEKAELYRTKPIQKLAPRGLIYDRNKRVLASVQPKTVITAVPEQVKQSPWVLDKLAEILEVPKQTLEKEINDGMWRKHFATPIYVGLRPQDVRIATRIAEAGDDLPGVAVETQPMRVYADTTSLSHIMGYVWKPNDKDVERLRDKEVRPAIYVGKEGGVEAVYEKLLMGVPGEDRFEVDSRGRPTKLIGRNNPIPGTQLILSIDLKLQRVAHELLKGFKGAIVALVPSTGEVLCLVSVPTYDTKIFEGGIRSAEYANLWSDDAPLLNRAIYSSYSPGSTFKPVTTIASLMAGQFDPNRTVFCPGYYQVGNRPWRCLGRHGSITFKRAMAKSCNTYFAEMADRARGVNLMKAAEGVGFNQPTLIDLLGEGKGILPTDEWRAKWRQDPKWYPGDNVNMGIGQGETAATPIQMACLAALLANGGVSYQPHILRATIDPGDEAKVTILERKELHRVDAPASFWNAMRQALVAVIEEGTALGARIPGLTWAGKTGSAEKRGQKKTNSWFIGYAPAHEPKIAVAVVAEGVGHGSEVAAPIARELVKAYLLRDSSASESASPASSASAAAGRSPASR